MKIGKLYEFKYYFWLIYPSKDIAAAAFTANPFGVSAILVARTYAASYAEYWSKEFNCNVSYIEPNSIFCLLEQDGKCCKILSTNGELGWIYLDNRYKDDIKEVKV